MIERILRSCLRVGEFPAHEECHRNFWRLEESEIQFPEPEDQAVHDYLRQWYQAYDQGPDIALLREYFEKDDKLEVVTRINELAKSQFFIRSNFDNDVKTLAEQQQVKRYVQTLRRAAGIAEHGAAIGKQRLRGLAQAHEYLIAEASKLKVHERAFQSPSEAAESYLNFLEMPRFETGIETLDADGGLPAHRFVIVGGAPGAGKTSFCVHLAHRWMLDGHPVMFLAVDESGVGISGRLAVRIGLSKAQLARRDRDAIADFERHLRQLAFEICDGVTVEAAADRLARLATKCPGKTPVLIVDSLQRCSSKGSAAADSAKTRVEAVVGAAKGASVRHKMLVLATCELSRAAYRQADERIEDIAAGKESGAIEYAAETLLILRNVKGTPDLIDVTVPKNRGLRQEPFRLRLDRHRMSYEEVAVTSQEEHKVAQQVRDAAVLERVLLTSGGIKGQRAIREAMKSAGVGSNERTDAALRSLMAQGRVRKDADGHYRCAPVLSHDEMFYAGAAQ